MKNDKYINQRSLEFLRESDAIDNITNIDYELLQNRQFKKGHCGAFQHSQRLARNHQPLTVKEICKWQEMITSEQITYGHKVSVEIVGHLRSPKLPININAEDHVSPSYDEVPNLMEVLLSSLNKRLTEEKSFPNIVEIVCILSDFFQQFVALKPFAEANGRTGRLFLNYIATWFKCPLIIMRGDDQYSIHHAHHNKYAMRLFLGKKIQEVALNQEGNLLPLAQQYQFSALYQDPSIPGVLIVEWHELIQAMDEWKYELSACSERNAIA